MREQHIEHQLKLETFHFAFSVILSIPSSEQTGIENSALIYSLAEDSNVKKSQ